MKAVTDNRLLGNFGEAHVSALLSAGGCFVRPVADGTDIGVDLYCETNVRAEDAKNQTPFLHFWVQVRAGAQCQIDGDQVKIAFSQSELAYWYRQPIPVFAALVSTVWPPTESPDVYFLDVGSELVYRGPPTTGLTLRSHLRVPAYDQERLDFLLHHFVPTATTILDCRRGVVGTRPTLLPQYTTSSPMMPAGNYSNAIIIQLRRTAANSIVSIWRLNQLLDPAFISNRQMLARVVGQFVEHDEPPHWENPFALALSVHADGEYSRAKALYEQAKRVIVSDPNVSSTDDLWARHLMEIDILAHEANHESPPCTPIIPIED